MVATANVISKAAMTDATIPVLSWLTARVGKYVSLESGGAVPPDTLIQGSEQQEHTASAIAAFCRSGHIIDKADAKDTHIINVIATIPLDEIPSNGYIDAV